MNEIQQKEQQLNIMIILLYIGMYIILNIGIIVAVIITKERFINDDGVFDQTFIAFSNLLYYLVLTIAIVLVAKTYLFKKQWKLTKDNIRNVIGLSIAGFFLLYISQALSMFLISGFDLSDTSVNQASLENLLNGSPLAIYSLIIFAVILAPIAEEMVFRKAVYGLLEPRITPIGAILVSGLLFGLVHVISESFIDFAFIGALVPYVLMGISLGWIYYLSNKKIIVPIIAHMLWNGIAVLLMFIL